MNLKYCNKMLKRNVAGRCGDVKNATEARKSNVCKPLQVDESRNFDHYCTSRVWLKRSSPLQPGCGVADSLYRVITYRPQLHDRTSSNQALRCRQRHHQLAVSCLKATHSVSLPRPMVT